MLQNCGYLNDDVIKNFKMLQYTLFKSQWRHDIAVWMKRHGIAVFFYLTSYPHRQIKILQCHVFSSKTFSETWRRCIGLKIGTSRYLVGTWTWYFDSGLEWGLDSITSRLVVCRILSCILDWHDIDNLKMWRGAPRGLAGM